MKTLLQAVDTNPFGNIMILLLYIIIGLFVFLIIRGFFLWYYKIYEVLNNQKEQIRVQNETNELLREIRDQYLIDFRERIGTK
ncbi:hypothetical protein ACP6L2_03335 [Sphingobacterium lactis]|uniref:hypothetical protein n=1 Tax=Sphingobacterium lactis TaxID=797291 RepID=UPI003F7D84EC